MNTSTRHRTAGFTVIELIVVIIILATASILFFYQKNTLQTASLDERRKTEVNSIYYTLEEVYYEKNKSYPAELTSSNLTAIDPSLLSNLSEYSYEPVNCDTDGKCKGYTLRVTLTNEAEYVKKSRRS